LALEGLTSAALGSLGMSAVVVVVAEIMVLCRMRRCQTMTSIAWATAITLSYGRGDA